ncbi:MAG: ABC transporter permease [Pseudomonadota bacterium]
MELWPTTEEALRLLLTGDTTLWGIVWISLRVSLLALLIAMPPAVATGFLLATVAFPGRRVVVVVLQSFLSFPTVVVGLVLYVLLARSGPLGEMDLLYSQAAMIIGQAIIAFPVLAAFTLASVQGADQIVHETAISLGASPTRAAMTTLFEVRFAVMAGLFNGFGRVISEVGCAMMVGGNIAGTTRNIPTAISLETAKGEFAQGIALGIVLIVLAMLINGIFHLLQGEGGLQ